MDHDREYRLARAEMDVESGLPKKRTALKLRHKAQETQQRLTTSEERFLALWIKNEEGAGRSPTKAEASDFASCILEVRVDLTGIGKHWIDGFLYRNNDISLKDSRALESSRAKESKPQRIATFYESLGREINKKRIKPKNIINLDENGVQEGESSTGKVLGSVLRKGAEVKKSESTTWVSILEATPKKNNRQEQPQDVFFTPKQSHDLKRQSRKLESELDEAKRDFRTLINKAGKTIDLQTSEIASLRYQLREKDLEIEALTPVPKKKVKITDPNKRYVEWQDIWESRNGLKERQAELTAKKKTLNAMAKNFPESHDAHEAPGEWAQLRVCKWGGCALDYVDQRAVVCIKM
ncbi:hypothetical protein DL771_009962 [Monosporascus sp. 5C6A]|nr:hypothetical protein DL771_009962 [Monosporascus sp. 5C6A]